MGGGQGSGRQRQRECQLVALVEKQWWGEEEEGWPLGQTSKGNVPSSLPTAPLSRHVRPQLMLETPLALARDIARLRPPPRPRVPPLSLRTCPASRRQLSVRTGAEEGKVLVVALGWQEEVDKRIFEQEACI